MTGAGSTTVSPGLSLGPLRVPGPDRRPLADRLPHSGCTPNNESRQSGKLLPQISPIQFVTYFYIAEKHLNSGSAIVSTKDGLGSVL